MEAKEIKALKKKIRRDGWLNTLSGMGKKNRDKRTATTFENTVYLTDEELCDIFIGDGMGNKIISCVANEMTRKWIELQGDKEDANQVMEILNLLRTETQINTGIKYQRSFGGSLIVIGTNDGQEYIEELKLDNIKAIDYLKVYDSTMVDIQMSVFESDLNSPRYGMVEVYAIRNPLLDLAINIKGGANLDTHILVHHSRVLEFFGIPMPTRAKGKDSKARYWGMPILQTIYEQLKDTNSIFSNVSTIVYELIISVFNFVDLDDMLAEGNEDDLINRMEIINTTKSIINAVLLGEGDTFERNAANIGGVADIIDRFMILLAAVSNIPVTILWGRSPAGENATGESDMRNYYDMIQSKQKNDLKFPLQKLVNIISAFLKIAEPPTIKFNPLVQMTEKEIAEINKLEADTYKVKADGDKVYLDYGILEAEEVITLRGFDNIEEDTEDLE